MFQRDFRTENKFFEYNPQYEAEQRLKRTSYLLALDQSINPGKKMVSVEAPRYTDKKYAQVGAG